MLSPGSELYLLLILLDWTTAVPTSSFSSFSQLGNAWCSDAHFHRTFLAPGARNADGLPTARLREFDTPDAGWQRLLSIGAAAAAASPHVPSRGGGVCPCHNAGFTAASEQWDGRPSSGMDAVSGECYFSIPRCSQYLDRGNCPGASPNSSPTATAGTEAGPRPASILVATTTPYTASQLSTRQAGRCAASCVFTTPTPGQPVNLADFDGIVWPLDWSFGGANTLPVPTDPELTRTFRYRQLWIAFSEEDMFKTEGGRPDLWRNRSFLSLFNLTSTYDYASSDLPFNLWRFHFFGPCTANVYFAPPPDFSDAFTIYEAEIINNDQTDDQTDNPSSLVSYISRNCRVQRDAWVRRLMSILPVASLGKCLRNTAWPFRKASYPYWQEKVLVLRRYPFTLAIEGSDTPGKSGLVSEKLFDAFAAGTVPIYWGAPRHVVERFAPSPESFIHVDDFPEGVEQLASYLKSLARNPAEYYAKHHAWRNAMSEPVVNSNGGRNNDAQRTEGFLPRFCELLDTNINTLACRMCEKVSAHRDKVLAEEGASHFTPASERNDEKQHDDKPKNDSELTPVLVLGIKSAVGDRALRDAIRSSWVTPLAAANGVHDGPSGRGDRFDITFLIIGDGPNGEVTDANHILALREEAEKSSVPLLVTAMHESGNSNLRVGAAGPVLNFARDLLQRGIVSADTLSDELVDSAADPASVVYIVICKATVVPHIDNILWEFLGGTIGAEGTVRTPQPRRRKRLYMGHVEEYATGKAQPITSGALGVSSEGKIDVEHWPPYAQSDMYVLSSDVMAWLGSDAARTLQQVEPVGVVAARLGDSVGESPILASWLLMIQVHAQHGGTGCGVNGQDAVWLDPFGHVVRAGAPASDCGASAERTTTKFATTGFNTAGDMLKYWAFEEERRLKC